MLDLNISYKSDEKLIISKSPSLKSWSPFFGLLSVAFGASIYGSDQFLLALVCITGASVIGLSFLDDWEDCIFDRSSGQLHLIKQSFWQKALLWLMPMSRLVQQSFPLRTIIEVSIKETLQAKSYASIQLLLVSGMKLPLFETWKSLSFAECESVATKIRKFLQFERIEQLDCIDYDSDASSCFDSATSISNSSSRSSINEEEEKSSVPWRTRERVEAINI